MLSVENGDGDADAGAAAAALELEPLFTDEFYSNFTVINAFKSPRVRPFRWLIKPADRLIFENGTFPGEYYDNGMLGLRNQVIPEIGLRDITGLNHSHSIQRLLFVLIERNLFQIQDTRSEDGIQLVDESLGSLLEIFQCPICLDPCFPPVYACPNSHNLCGTCRNSLLSSCFEEGSGIKCPTCRINTDFAYSFGAMGEVVGYFDFKCRYVEHGCREILSGLKFVRHCRDKCTFRPWRCYYCPQIVNVRSVYEHLSTFHGQELPLMEKGSSLLASFEFEAPMSPFNERSRLNGEIIKVGCICIKSEGFFFVFEMEVSYGIYAWCICFQGSPWACAKYEAHILLRTTYDVGGGREHEHIADIFENQKVISCQNEMRDILATIQNTAYPGDGLAMKDFSRHGGAGKFQASIHLRISRR